jgi:hypothetical protein
MLLDNKVVKKFGDEERIDKFVLASAMYAASFEGASCSLIEGQVLRNCDGCNMRFLCGKIDKVVEEYTERTTVVVGNFRFGE